MPMKCPMMSWIVTRTACWFPMETKGCCVLPAQFPFVRPVVARQIHTQLVQERRIYRTSMGGMVVGNVRKVGEEGQRT